MSNILLVDDDLELCELLSTWLNQDGFSVSAVHACANARAVVSQQTFDALVLDVMLPDGNGLELLKQLRQQQVSVPVVMLSARGEPLDRILGLELGADDYLPKPCDPRELSARLKAVLRRSQSNTPTQLGTGAKANLHCGDLTLISQRGLVLIGEHEIELTPTESDLLGILLSPAGELCSKEVLSERVLGKRLMPYDRSLDVHISNLRKKLGPNADGQPRLQSIRGRGYRYVA
ncbi:response regulator transcription factor [Atopomonas sediminilitoris]|uniref:response regulator transcription factor n=1 Tax=Atopomonas sediminilitoris TaxID=2919919 RepID=UPI001F4D6721|nr:response regulator transcription factor [Atopomonas sediminilitoris]MCJ8169056.1 response regulator transcription factor [Atopomonas sediminilitoris]